MISTFSRLLSRILLFYQPADEPLVPLMLTPDEASTLYLSARLMEVYAEGRRAEDAAHIQQQIASALPPAIRTETETLGEVVASLRPTHRLHLDDAKLLALQQAILDRRVVRVAYQSYGQEDPAAREIEPYGLHFRGGVWYLDGYCRKAQGQRSFRLARMGSIRLLDEGFEARFTTQPAELPYQVRVRFEPDVLIQVREQQHETFRREEPALGQRTRIMVYEVRTFDEIVPWLMSWGAFAEVLEPEDLRDVIHQEALRMVHRVER